MRTVDIGNPQWAMHSIRETAGVDDTAYAVELFKVREKRTASRSDPFYSASTCISSRGALAEQRADTLQAFFNQFTALDAELTVE